MHTVRSGPLTGLIAQVSLLSVIAVSAGLGAAGWAGGLAYGVVTCLALSRGLNRAGATRLGPADRVTLTRATLVGGVTALAADSYARHVPVAPLVAIASVALLLDAVDGKVARRTNTVSALGARFDMEVDAFLILVLGCYLAPTLGAWVLTMGLMRYAFVAFGWVLPWMRGGLPARRWRKVVAATQGIVLAAAASALMPRPVTIAVLVVALAMLVESFGRDVGWLWRHAHAQHAHAQHGHAQQSHAQQAHPRRVHLPLGPVPVPPQDAA